MSNNHHFFCFLLELCSPYYIILYIGCEEVEDPLRAPSEGHTIPALNHQLWRIYFH